MIKNIYCLIFCICISFLVVSCDSKKNTQGNESPSTHQDYTLQALYSANKNLLNKAPNVDSDMAAYYYYNYADSLLASLNLNEENAPFRPALAKIYTAGANIWLGMAYKWTITYHAKHPESNAMFKRSDEVTRVDALLNDFRDKADPLSIIYLKDAWIEAMINFYKMRESRLYEGMEGNYQKHLNSMDQVLKDYNKEDAFKILLLHSERALFFQTSLMAADLRRLNSKNEKETLDEFWEEVDRYAGPYKKMPESYDKVLKMNDTEYYEMLYASAYAVNKMFEVINSQI